MRPHEDSDPATPPASLPAASCHLATPRRGVQEKARPALVPHPAAFPASLRAMDAPEQQPDPDGGDAPGHEGNSQDELDFSILFDYDYLNPIEGPWRFPPAWPPSPGWGLGSGHRTPVPLQLPAGLGGWRVPGEREGLRHQGLLPPLGGGRLTLAPSCSQFPVTCDVSPRVTGNGAKGGRGLRWPLACVLGGQRATEAICSGKEEVRQPKNEVSERGLGQKEVPTEPHYQGR